MSKVPYYRGVRGSAALATRALGAAAPAAEAIEPGEMRRVAFAGELLGAVRVRAAFAAIPLDAFDRASADLEAEEQAAYLHLLRLSVAEGRNWCRIAKKDLMDRLRLSERRLLRVLAALVEKRYARPLDRDNRGTLWRVYLPREAVGEPVGEEVLLGRATELRVVRAAPPPTPPHAPRGEGGSTPRVATPPHASRGEGGSTPCVAPPPPTPPHASRGEGGSTPRVAPPPPTPPHASRGEESSTPRAVAAPTAPSASRAPRRPRAVQGDDALARALATARGHADAEGLAAALAEVRELLAEGQPRERIAACIETVRRRAARGGGGAPP